MKKVFRENDDGGNHHFEFFMDFGRDFGGGELVERGYGCGFEAVLLYVWRWDEDQADWKVVGNAL